jgi:hypothetical protein
MNTNLASPGLFFKDSNGDLVKTGPVHVGTTAPNATPASGGQAGNSKGELWLDTSGSDYTLKTWDGSAWREIVVTSAMIKDGTIVDADVNASAAIAGTKVAPNFGSQTITTTGVISPALGTAALPSVAFTGDTDTGIFSPGADQVAISTNGSEAARIDSSGSLLVRASTETLPGDRTAVWLQSHSNGLTQASAGLFQWGSNTGGSADLVFGRSLSATVGTQTAVTNNVAIARIRGYASDGTNFGESARIEMAADAAATTGSTPGRLVFSVTADGASSPTERMRIDSSGFVHIATVNAIVANSGTADGITFRPPATVAGIFQASNDNNVVALFRRRNSNGSLLVFYRDTTSVGSISVTTTNTAYNTSSDYRLKENVVPLTGAIDRLQQIPVHRFNFIADPDTVVDGFIAHEAAEVVPECVTGTKDEVDEDGNPVYQGIDQSKIVPLAVAALQEALQKVEDLENRLTVAGL